MDDFLIIPATIFSGISIILFFVVLKIIFIDLRNYEKRINRLCKEKREKIQIAKEFPTFSCSASGLEREMLDNKIEDYDLQIEELERKRRFLLDKLPFLKK